VSGVSVSGRQIFPCESVRQVHNTFNASLSQPDKKKQNSNWLTFRPKNLDKCIRVTIMFRNHQLLHISGLIGPSAGGTILASCVKFLQYIWVLHVEMLKIFRYCIQSGQNCTQLSWSSLLLLLLLLFCCSQHL
jgi:hypothetical protein